MTTTIDATFTYDEDDYGIALYGVTVDHLISGECLYSYESEVLSYTVDALLEWMQGN